VLCGMIETRLGFEPAASPTHDGGCTIKKKNSRRVAISTEWLSGQITCRECPDRITDLGVRE
jgi:hypothetical protein